MDSTDNAVNHVKKNSFNHFEPPFRKFLGHSVWSHGIVSGSVSPSSQTSMKRHAFTQRLPSNDLDENFAPEMKEPNCHPQGSTKTIPISRHRKTDKSKFLRVAIASEMARTHTWMLKTEWLNKLSIGDVSIHIYHPKFLKIVKQTGENRPKNWSMFKHGFAQGKYPKQSKTYSWETRS